MTAPSRVERQRERDARSRAFAVRTSPPQRKTDRGTPLAAGDKQK